MIKVYLDEFAKMPTKAHNTDAGFDLYAPDSVIVKAKSDCFVDTGVHIEIPKGFVGMVKSKSGLNCKYGLVCEGVIDSGYTGAICVEMYNHSYNDYEFQKGDKITQLVIMPILEEELTAVNSLDDFDDTERGFGGFGSSGK